MIKAKNIVFFMSQIKLRDDGSCFRHDDTQIPKFNYRDLRIGEAEITDDRTLELSVSSNLPYRRYSFFETFDEILDHSEAAVNLSRFNDGAMLLYNHNRDDYIGVIERAWLEGNKLQNKVRFDTHELAEKILTSVRSGVIRNVSIGYAIDSITLDGEKDGVKIYRATAWTPFETSLVTVPADASVGVGRSFWDMGENSQEKSKVKSQKSKITDDKLLTFDSGLLTSKREEQSDMVELPTLDKDKLLREERERTAGIYAVGNKYNCPDLAAKAVENGWSIQKLRSEILEREPEQTPVATVSTPVDLDNREAANYSLLRTVGYQAGRISPREAGLEIEVSDHIQDSKMRGKPPEGIYFDTSRLMSRAPLETGDPVAAGNLIETDLLVNRLLGFLYNNSAFLQLGVTVLEDLTSNIKIPRTINAPKAYWTPEKQDFTEDNLGFDTISLDPKKIAVFSSCTYEMIQQAEVSGLEQMMRNALITGITLEIDRTIGFGSGIDEEPLGIIGTPGVNSFSLGANGGALDWAALVQMQTLIDDKNALMGDFSYVINSRTKGKLMTTLEHDNGEWIWRNSTDPNEGMLAGYRARRSNQIPNNFVKGTANNLTAAIFGNFSQVMLGFWSVLDVMVDPYTQAKNAIINVIAKQLCDLEVTRGEYFSVLTDIQNN